MNTYTREQLSELLHSGECIVEFTKVNGEVRSMPCTLKSELFTPPVVIEPETPKQEKKANPDVMSVWCLDKKSWRSFRIANVISAKTKE
jgi:hypothetical protein